MAAPNAVRSGTTGCNRRNPVNRITFEPHPAGLGGAVWAVIYGFGFYAFSWSEPVYTSPENATERTQGERPMRILSAAAVVVLLTAPAYAQIATPNINLIPELTSKTPEEKEQDAIKEKAYKESLKKIPDAKVSSDPWGTVRNNEAPKAATAPAKPKTKTVSSTAGTSSVR